MYRSMAALAVALCLTPACGRGADESHNSSQAGATARAGAADAGNQPDVTLVGCLTNADRPSDAAPVGTAGAGSSGGAKDQGAAGRGSIGERFTLTGARSESAASDPAAASYVLDGDLEQLRGHVDQQVRVRGILDAAASNTAGPQRVRVNAVETIAASCAAPGSR
jgi:hypothetical protein